MTGPLLDALERLERALDEQSCPVVKGLQPGLGEGVIRRWLREQDFAPPEDLLVLYGWHDGYLQPVDEPRWVGMISPGMQQLSLNEALSSYPFVKETIDMFDSDPERRWFPVISDGGGGYVVINCGDDPATRGIVASFDAELDFSFGYRPRTLAEPVEWWAGFLESGTYVYEVAPDGTPTWDSRIRDDQLTPNQLASGMV
jgi:hypothetical protein